MTTAKRKSKKETEKTFKQYQKEYEKMVLQALEKNPDIYQFKDIALVVKPCRATLYNYQLDKLDSIKEKLEDNLMNFKRALRNDMRKTKNPSCLIALYKLLGTQEERDALNNNRVDVNANVGISTKELFLEHLKGMGSAD